MCILTHRISSQMMLCPLPTLPCPFRFPVPLISAARRHDGQSRVSRARAVWKQQERIGVVVLVSNVSELPLTS